MCVTFTTGRVRTPFVFTQLCNVVLLMLVALHGLVDVVLLVMLCFEVN